LFVDVRWDWCTTGVIEFDTSPALHNLVPAYEDLQSEGNGVMGSRS
jgi:hypothetical protein